MIKRRARRRSWTIEEDNKLKEFYPFKNFKELIKILPNQSISSIRWRASKLSIKKIGYAWNDEKDQKLKFLWENAKSRKEICHSFPNYSWNCLRKRAEFLKLKTNVIRNRFGDLSNLLNDSLESYYWMGFVAADGWINHKTGQLVMQLSNKDKDHLQLFANFLNTSVKDVPRNMSRVTVQDKILAPQIINKFGFQNHKTLNPPNINFKGDKFIAFFTGFIDGDGSIILQGNKSSIRVEIHANWLNTLKQFLEQIHIDLGFNIPIRDLAKINSYGYAAGGLYRKDIVKKFKNKILELEIPFLKRKWDRIK